MRHVLPRGTDLGVTDSKGTDIKRNYVSESYNIVRKILNSNLKLKGSPDKGGKARCDITTRWNRNC